MERPPGVEFHTFTAIGRCPRTGRLGVGTATRSLAVGARVCHVRARLGAVAIMAIADARLGHTALRLLELGHKAPSVVDELVRADPYAEYRQLGVIDADGFAAARTGKMNRDWAGHQISATELARASVDMPLAAPSIITNGTSVGRRPASGSWARASAWVANTPAVTHRGPSRAATGTKKSRPGSCIAPIQPIIAAATAGV